MSDTAGEQKKRYRDNAFLFAVTEGVTAGAYAADVLISMDRDGPYVNPAKARKLAQNIIRDMEKQHD